jgi:hypothetical protein
MCISRSLMWAGIRENSFFRADLMILFIKTNNHHYLFLSLFLILRHSFCNFPIKFLHLYLKSFNKYKRNLWDKAFVYPFYKNGKVILFWYNISWEYYNNKKKFLYNHLCATFATCIWYDPGKVKFGFWCKMCTYLVLRQQS